MSGDRLHELAEARSLALHQAVAERLREEPELISTARERVASWRRSGSVAPVYAEAWAELLAGDLDALLAALADPGERARALRQVTPFAGAIDPRRRWRIWREARLSFEGR
ncbi:MAG TPA: hypothetical protein VFS60_04610 [Thermoanaerobaculia bacterium]|nr:hypothetical protein [Thermoanaerobaculia bacterium]